MWTQEDKDQRLLEVTDPNKVAVFCSKHQYYGPSKVDVNVKPSLNCGRCWFVFYLHDMMSVPPGERAKRLDELDEVLHKLSEEVEKGRGDQFKVNRHPEISYGDS